MTSGFDALSLAVFTSLAPGGVVAFIALALARIGARNPEAAVRLDRMIALPFAVVLTGFIASATHLGTPANALHVFSGIGRSPLSNEVLAAVAFLFLAGSYWMAAFKERFPDAVAKPWLVLACAAGVALVACTSVAYTVSTVPTWDSPYTPADLVLSAALTGPVLALLFLELAHARLRPLEGTLLALAAASLAAGTVVLGMHEASLGGIANNEFSASSLVPDYGAVVALHLALGAAGIAAAAWSLRRGQAERLTLILRVAACVLVLAAVFATRIEFYHLHMTVGF
ncbi:dimethyl sulfoxide reductase anchor subunit family protein [Arabiibacter massiliensis]|uniref:dimethyl sulfoxide reductase anchor subunit family protein n=1 Tax=Arabiibacter massiliensis TaxID=1870985 RepID=UPI0009BABA06|nr:DmsC/YnfH family molybdoenzyme membrane anchor subunit [Arabiibacter massiliensis]